MMKPTQVVKALAALAQSTRLAIYRLLVTCGPEGMAAGQIAVNTLNQYAILELLPDCACVVLDYI